MYMYIYYTYRSMHRLIGSVYKNWNINFKTCGDSDKISNM